MTGKSPREHSVATDTKVEEAITRTIKGVQIFKSGLHRDSQGREKEWSPEDVENILQTFSKGIPSSVPVKLGHTSTEHNAAVAEGLGLPASVLGGEEETGRGAATLGKVTALYHEGDLLVADLEVPDKIASLVTDGMFTNVSSEILDDYQGNGPALSGLALLGAERPAVKDLETLTGISVLDEGIVPDHSYVFEFTGEKRKKKKSKRASAGDAVMGAVDLGITVGTRGKYGRQGRRYAEFLSDDIHNFALASQARSAVRAGSLFLKKRKKGSPYTGLIKRKPQIQHSIKKKSIGKRITGAVKDKVSGVSLPKRKKPGLAFQGKNKLTKKPYSKKRMAAAQAGDTSATGRQIKLKNRFERRKNMKQFLGKRNVGGFRAVKGKGSRTYTEDHTYHFAIGDPPSAGGEIEYEVPVTVEATNTKTGETKKHTVVQHRMAGNADQARSAGWAFMRSLLNRYGDVIGQALGVLTIAAAGMVLTAKVGAPYTRYKGPHEAKGGQERMKTEPRNLLQFLSRVFGTRGGYFQETPHLSESDDVHEFAMTVKRHKVKPKEKFLADITGSKTTKVGKKTYKTEMRGWTRPTIEKKARTVKGKNIPGGHIRAVDYKTTTRRVRKFLPDVSRKTTRSRQWDVSHGTAGKKPGFKKDSKVPVKKIMAQHKSWIKSKNKPKKFADLSDVDNIHEFAIGLTGLVMGLGIKGAARLAPKVAKAMVASPTKNPITILGIGIIGKKLYDAVVARVNPQGPGQLELKTADNKKVQVWAVDPKGVRQEVNKAMPGWQVIQQGLASGVAGSAEGLISGAARALFTDNMYNYHEEDGSGSILPEHVHDIHGNPIMTHSPEPQKRGIGRKVAGAIAGTVAVGGSILAGGIAMGLQRKLSDKLFPARPVEHVWVGQQKGPTIIDGKGRTVYSEADDLFRYKELINA